MPDLIMILVVRHFVRLCIFLSLFVSLNVSADNLSVAVAANMQFVFDDLKAQFQRDTGHTAQGIVNSSGKLVSQISHGAPFDVFLSADLGFPDTLYRQGFATGAPKIYAYGALVIWTYKDLDLKNWRQSLQGTQIRQVALANPASSPYGRESMRALQVLKLEQSLRSRLVFAESIAQVNQYIHSGVVDWGITAKSVVLSDEMKGKGKWLDLPANSYTPIAQAVVILQPAAKNRSQAAQAFVDFLSAASGRAILQKHGYSLP